MSRGAIHVAQEDLLQMARNVLGNLEANNNVELPARLKCLCELAMLDAARGHIFYVGHTLVTSNVAQPDRAQQARI